MSATRILGQITTALAGTPDPDRLSLLKLTLNEKLETLRGLNAEIIELTPEEGLEGEIQQSDEYKENMYDALTRINRVVKGAVTPSTPATEEQDPDTSWWHGAPYATAKLPKLSLP